MSSYKQAIAVTNRTLCEENYPEQIEKVARLEPCAIILREKDLSDEAYRMLAIDIIQRMRAYHTRLILHSHVRVAIELEWHNIHLPIHMLRALSKQEQEKFCEIGVSIHCVQEALEAEKLGATYVTAGHIYTTDCKKGVEPRGLDFLREIVEQVKIPVYGIGGIHRYNAKSVLEQGAAGVCMMSEFMKMK